MSVGVLIPQLNDVLDTDKSFKPDSTNLITSFLLDLGLIKSVQNFKQSVSSMAIYKNNYHPEIFQNLTFTVKFIVPETVWPLTGFEMLIVGGTLSFGMLFTKTLIDGISN